MQSEGTGRVILCQTSDLLAEVDRLAGQQDVVLALAEQGLAERRLPSGALVLPFEGQLVEQGDTIHIGRGYEVELQDYLAIPFVPVTRPTIVRLSSFVNWEAFVADADEAQATGAFIPQMTSSSVVLADRSVLDAVIDQVDVSINRLTVDQAGAVHYWPDAPSVAPIAEFASEPEMQPTSAYFANVGGEETEQLIRERPWLRRYLAALRIAGQQGGDTWSVSGFGRTLAGADFDRGARTTGEILIWRDDEYQLVVTDSGRRFNLGRDTAVVIESLLETESLDAAIARITAAGLARQGLERDLADLQRRFAGAGVVLGPETLVG
ncbi:hypothetical protein C5C31_09245 [Rathayibacter rathayi]|nr:hypothetical protein C5C02_09485 [Rathayibacter rathayi]PPG76563.1 hypothetical protein C5C23_07490 [Rathayibacter rathayi]PPH22251.1 hypothetical protein C5C31_09245 [Rathayibacter rathayi]PPH36997.1 hypothetical protein C5C28_04830 [Rathayibacter rathayi]PPH64287.1 hypothetical protein C5C45_12875 [Rathayibacter rathayi]